MEVIKALELLLDRIRQFLRKDSDIYGQYEVLPSYCMYSNNKVFYKEIQSCIDLIKNNITNKDLLDYIRKSYFYSKKDCPESCFSISSYRIDCYKKFCTFNFHEDQFDDYYFFSLFVISFDYYKANNDHIVHNNVLSKDDIIKLYEEKGVKILNDEEFYKNGLVTFNPDFHLLDVDNYNQILTDQRLDKSFNLEIDWIIARELKKLLIQKNIKKLSFRPISISEFIFGLEEFQTGQPFNLTYDNLKSRINVLFLANDYEVSFKDKLFVKTEANSITFEEIYDEEHVETIDNFYLTRLVHFQLEKKDNTYYITHFDYEKIYYSKRNYSLKLNKISLKGEKKVKYFKVDFARIPLDYEITVPLYNEHNKKGLFIYLIVHNTFIYKDLVNEYFSKYLNTGIGRR